MPLFLHQWSYKDDQIKRMLIEDTDRAEVVRIAIEAFGGTLRSFYYCFGMYDGLAISEFPDSATAFSCLLSIAGQGRVRNVSTTALFSPEEGLRAMQNAGAVLGAPPSHGTT
jgi:uncharacterized protein with GYD domain